MSIRSRMRFLYTLIEVVAVVAGGSSVSDCPRFILQGHSRTHQVIDQLLGMNLSKEERNTLCDRIESINLQAKQKTLTEFEIVSLSQFADNLMTTVRDREDNHHLSGRTVEWAKNQLKEICPSVDFGYVEVDSELITFPFDKLDRIEKGWVCDSVLRPQNYRDHQPHIVWIAKHVGDRLLFEDVQQLASKIKGKRCKDSSRFVDLVDHWRDQQQAELVSSEWSQYNPHEKAILCAIWQRWKTNTFHPDARTVIYMLSDIHNKRVRQEHLQEMEAKFSTLIRVCETGAEHLDTIYRGFPEVLDELEKIAQRDPIGEELQLLCAMSPYGSDDDRDALTVRINYRKNEWDESRWQSAIEEKCAKNGFFARLGDHAWFNEYMNDMHEPADIRNMCGYFSRYTQTFGTLDYYIHPADAPYKEYADEFLASVLSRKIHVASAPDKSAVDQKRIVEIQRRCQSSLSPGGRDNMESIPIPLLLELSVVGNLRLKSLSEYCRILVQFLMGTLDAQSAKRLISSIGYNHGFGLRHRFGKIYRGANKRTGGATV